MQCRQMSSGLSGRGITNAEIVDDVYDAINTFMYASHAEFGYCHKKLSASQQLSHRCGQDKQADIANSDFKVAHNARAQLTIMILRVLSDTL